MPGVNIYTKSFIKDCLLLASFDDRINHIDHISKEILRKGGN